MTPGTVVVLVLASLVATLVAVIAWSVRQPKPISTKRWPQEGK